IGVPIQSRALDGMDSLLSIVQMPGGVPTATTAIGKAGAKNAGLFAAQILGVTDEKVEQALVKNRETMKENVDEMRDDLANKKSDFTTRNNWNYWRRTIRSNDGN